MAGRPFPRQANPEPMLLRRQTRLIKRIARVFGVPMSLLEVDLAIRELTKIAEKRQRAIIVAEQQRVKKQIEGYIPGWLDEIASWEERPALILDDLGREDGRPEPRLDPEWAKKMGIDLSQPLFHDFEPSREDTIARMKALGFITEDR